MSAENVLNKIKDYMELDEKIQRLVEELNVLMARETPVEDHLRNAYRELEKAQEELARIIGVTILVHKNKIKIMAGEKNA